MRMYEPERGRMSAEELFDRFRRWDFRATGCGSAKEVEELVTVSRGETVCGVAHDVGMNVVGEIETDGKAAWVGFGFTVGDFRKAGGVGETCGDRSGFALDVRGFGERLRCACGPESSTEHQAFGVRGAEAGMRPEDFMELRQEVIGESNYSFVVRQRHRGSLRSYRLGETEAVIVKINGREEGIRENRLSPLRPQVRSFG